jgi:drug/metabolite transporter (DMT)-like permease
MLGMALLPTTLGHIALNHSFRYFAAQTVAVVNLHQFVFAGAMAWLMFLERPPAVFYFASALCVAGAAITVREAARIRRAEAGKG